MAQTGEVQVGCAVPDCAFSDDAAAAAPQIVCFQDSRHRMHAQCAYEWVAACGEREASCPLCRDTTYMAFVQQIVARGMSSRTGGGTVMPRTAHGDDVVEASAILPVQTTVDILRRGYIATGHLNALQHHQLGEVGRLVSALRSVVYSSTAFVVDAFYAAAHAVTVKQERDRMLAISPLVMTRVADLDKAFQRCRDALATFDSDSESESDSEDEDEDEEEDDVGGD